MNPRSPYLDDLIDVTPFVEVADELVGQCRTVAYASDDELLDADAIHGWVEGRAEAGDELVERAMRALFTRDCAWGVADLDHSPLDRYVWELTAEIYGQALGDRGMWFATVGHFESCGKTFDVSVHRPCRGCSDVPHMHVRMAHDPAVPDVCVGIFEPIYVPSGIRRCGFDDRHREDFANYMWKLESWADPWPIWRDVAELWIETCREMGVEAPDYPRGAEHRFPVPDYHMLHWPGDDGTRP